MSDPAIPDADATASAGEYVLGLLSPEDAVQLERDAAADPALAAEIAFWQRGLAPLLARVPPVPPPAELWHRLEASVQALPGARGAAQARRPPAARQTPAAPRTLPGRRTLAAWRAATAACALVAVAAVTVLVLAPSPPVPVAALEPTPAGHGPAIVALRAADGRLLLRPLVALAALPGRTLELWSLPEGAARPEPLGLMGADGIVVPAGTAPRTPGQLLVSLEPLGGAPAGLPTGPVAWAGTLAGAPP